jgi:hypothetical protein
MTEPGSTACDVSDLETDDSILKEDPRSSRKRPAPIVTHIPPPSDPSWIAESRKRIEDRGVPIYTPFTDVSETVLRSLEDAEKTRGGPKGILAEVTRIARKAFYQQQSNVLADDTDQESGAEQQGGSGEQASKDLLECIRRMMIIEARIRESSNTKSQAGKNRKKTAPKKRTLNKIPPGGPLGIIGVTIEGVPAMARPPIKQYSNEIYWKFAPDLESVSCGPRT